MRVLVTGGAGFLGEHVARHLVAGGAEVRLLDRAPPSPWEAAIGAERVNGDVRDDACVRRATRGADVVVHAAFAPPQAGMDVLREVNVGGTRSVCAAAVAAGASRLVLVSSTIVEEAARSSGLLRRSSLARLNAYRATRAEAEAVSAGYAGDLQVSIVRPKTFLGPGRVGAFAMVFDAVRRGAAVVIPGRGDNRYQLLDARDLAAGLRLLAVDGGAGLYHFGASDYATTAADLRALIDHAGTGARLVSIAPSAVRAGLRAFELAGMAPLSHWYQCAARGRDFVVDTGRARSELGWVPARSNARSLADAYDWYETRQAAGLGAPTTHPVPRGHRVLRRALDALGRPVLRRTGCW